MQGLEYVENQVDNLFELLLDLVLAAEEVGVVLGESADAGKAMEFTGLLVAVDGADGLNTYWDMRTVFLTA